MASIASRVTVKRLYEVQCGICGDNPDAEFYDSRTEADEARAAHIAEHEQDGGKAASAWADGTRHREF